jgi:hypothetical protein
VDDTNTSIRRLRQRLCGTGTAKTEAVVGRGSDKAEQSPQGGVAAKTAWAAEQAALSASAEQTTEDPA